MVQAFTTARSFDDFIATYPERGDRYELIEGEVIPVRPRGQHKLIAGFLSLQFGVQIQQRQLDWVIPTTCVVKPDRPAAGYVPDITILDWAALETEPLWERASTVMAGPSIQLVVEVVSTNWRDDYTLKLGDYEAMGIPEYWLVDYKALGAQRYIGSPKVPTLTVCSLVQGEYQVALFQGEDRVKSALFPALDLTAEQVFRAGRSGL
ncbi:Uma2 family endonuclease [Spirulina major CS-329]|uniref:Uma2 family endonuclease n=1 Tax=Spirulina TaxID=1154 RepID=UPI00232A9ECD|nr:MULTISPECIES: Uma2 family endonuclease [Spirulina]MDB9495821.1 Uma2 family endonuclease [Spirulina subsalsa CS-330]MDB9505464.1 Uma2 family endonuclease [Spirulina major CS-329]